MDCYRVAVPTACPRGLRAFVSSHENHSYTILYNVEKRNLLATLIVYSMKVVNNENKNREKLSHGTVFTAIYIRAILCAYGSSDNQNLSIDTVFPTVL